jgi:hypothetical protein
MNEKMQRKLRELGRAVFDAISESAEVSEALDLIRAEGYSLSMQLNCKKEPAEESVAPAPAVPALPARPPEFRIDGQDLTFLRSIGIDPTRRMRRRR